MASLYLSQLFYGYACEQEIKVICAVHNYMWLGNANGELRIIHATTMKTQFVRSLNTKDSTSACILDIVHVKADHKVMVSTLNCDVWIFLDVLDKGGLRLHSHLKFSDELLHMTVVDVNGSPEVWGTYSDKKVMVFQHHQSKWDYSVLQCEPFSDGRLYTVALATSSVFTGKHGDTKSHVWVSFNRRAYIVCWDAVEKKQLHVLNCKTDMQIGKLANTWSICTCEYAQLCITHIHTRARTHAHTHTRTHAHAHTHTHTHMQTL